MWANKSEQWHVLGLEDRLPEWHHACPPSPGPASAMVQQGRQDPHSFQPLLLTQCAKISSSNVMDSKTNFARLLNPQWSPKPKQQLQKAVLPFLCSPSCCPVFFCIFASLIFSLSLISKLSDFSIALSVLKLQRTKLKTASLIQTLNLVSRSCSSKPW